MSGGMEAAGDVATGALLGRAVEPGAGEHGASSGRGVCLNCGAALIGEFCHACGQNGHVHKTLGSIGHDLLHGVFHFEGKVWRTLPMLVAHPGALTRRYIDGERARFVSPLALFLFFVFLMFATINSLGANDALHLVNTSPEARARVDKQIADTQGKLTVAERRQTAGQPGAENESVDDLQQTLSALRRTRTIMTPMGQGGGLRVADTPHTGWARLDHGIAKVQTNPELAIYKLQSSAYKYSWALIPISVPFVALLFLWRRRFPLYDHAIFVTYSLSFMLLLTTVFSAALGVDAPSIFCIALIAIAPPVHLFVQLRGTYSLRWFGAAWRTVALLIFGIVTLLLFATLLIGMGLME